MADIQGLIRDPEFQGMPFEERRQLLSEADPDFAGVTPQEQTQILREMKSQPWWQGGGQKTSTPSRPSAPVTKKPLLDRVTEYITTPPERPSSLSEFLTHNLPRSAANTLYGAARMALQPGEAYQEAMGNPQTAGEVLTGLGGMLKSAVAPFGLAGGEAFKDAWTTAPVQSGLAVYPAAKGIPRAASAVRHPVRTLASALPDSAPQKMYESAMKFSNNPNVLSPVERRAAIDTGLEGGFRPVESDYSRLWNTVQRNKTEVNRIVDAGAQAGDTVSTARVLRPLGAIKKRFDTIRQQHPELAEAIDEVYSRYSQQQDIPVKEAQTLKETLQDLSRYADDDRSKATNRAYKAVGRGLRIELENLYPDLKALNKQSSALLNLENELAKAVGRVGNRDITSLGLRVALSGHPGSVGVTNAVLSIFEMPRIKARLAISLYKAKTGRTLPPSQWKKALAHPAVAAALTPPAPPSQLQEEVLEP